MTTMYSTDTELLDTEHRATAAADLLPELEAQAHGRTAAQPAADSDAACPRAHAAESLVQQMHHEAERYAQMSQHLDAVLHSGRVRRRTAWQRTRKFR